MKIKNVNKESEKIKNNSVVHKINEVVKGKENTEKGEQQNEKYSKAILKLARKGLSIGLNLWMMQNGNIGFNSAYDWSKLPHKLAGIGRIAQNIDMNKLKTGTSSLKAVLEFAHERRQEKKDGQSLIKPINFKGILRNISKSGKLPRTEDLNVVNDIMVEKKEIPKNMKEDRVC